MQGLARTCPIKRRCLEQALKDRGIHHSDEQADPHGSRGTFQNSTKCHLGGRAHNRACRKPGIPLSQKGTGSSGIHKLGSDLSRSRPTWRTFRSWAQNHHQVSRVLARSRSRWRLRQAPVMLTLQLLFNARTEYSVVYRTPFPNQKGKNYYCQPELPFHEIPNPRHLLIGCKSFSLLVLKIRKAYIKQCKGPLEERR